jgi:hypothetical protein
VRVLRGGKGWQGCGIGRAAGWRLLFCGVVLRVQLCDACCGGVVAAGAAFPLSFPSLDYSSSVTIIHLCILYPVALVSVCFCLLKMGLKNMRQWTRRGGPPCTAGSWKTVWGAAVAALQEKCLTYINWKFGTAGTFGRVGGLQ